MKNFTLTDIKKEGHQTTATVYADGNKWPQAGDNTDTGAHARPNTLPVIRPFQRLPNKIENCPTRIATALRKLYQGARILSIWECYLQITNQKLNNRSHPKKIDNSARLFIGAMHSRKFHNLSTHHRDFIVASFQRFARDFIPCYEPVEISSTAATDEASKLAKQFEELALNEERMAIWRGWHTTTTSGMQINIPLTPFFTLYGARWTGQIYETLDAWCSASRNNKPVAIKELGEFLLQHRPPSTALSDTLQVGNIWRHFWEYFESKHRHNKASVTIASWGKFRHIATEVLPSSGLIATPALGFPGPVPRVRQSHESHGSTGTQAASDEQLRLAALLVEVPLHLSDTKALESLLESVPTAISAIRSWADTGCRELLSRYRIQKASARHGLVRAHRSVNDIGSNKTGTPKSEKSNAERLENIAATYATFGFKTRQECRPSEIYGGDAKGAAEYLAIPTAKSLMPFATILVLEHPELTPSALNAIELLDRNGNASGLRPTNAGTYLVTSKWRKGHLAGELRLKLNAKSLRAIRTILVLTKQARKYLRDKQDDSWRFLFIETGVGFGYPLRVKHFPLDKEKVVSELQERAGLAPKDALRLANRFTLRSLRATVGIQKFIESHSEHVMARALGHEQFKPQLLARYLPPPILAFFRVRWIRVFQNSLVIRLTENTTWAMKASGFSTTEHMEEFLENNAFPKLCAVLREPPQASEITDEDGTFYLNASTQTLTFLARMARKVDSPPRYWSVAGRHILKVLEARHGIDPALDALLSQAQAAANKEST